MSEVLELVNEILRLRHVLLHASGDDEDSQNFRRLPDNFELSAKHHVHGLKKQAIQEVTKAGEPAFFGPKIKTAVEAFCSFAPAANREPVGSEGRVKRLLDSEEWNRLREALDELATYVPALTIADGIAAHRPDDKPEAAGSGVVHSTDFRSIRWFGVLYTFTTTQAACVKVLWQNWEQGTPVISEVTILDEAGSAGHRLRDVFDKGNHPALGTMITSAGKGAFQLTENKNS